MKTKNLLLITLLAFHLTGRAGELIYQTGFEPTAFQPGLPVRGQDGWEMFHEGEAISITTTNAHSGIQCLRFDGALLEPQASGSSMALCQLSSTALASRAGNRSLGVVEIQCDVRLDGPRVGTAGTPELDKLSANLYVGDTKYAGGFVVSSAGRIWTVSFAPGELYKYSVPYTFGTYRTLTLRANYITRTLTYLVDGVELGSSPINPTNTDQQLTRADLMVSGPTDPVHDGTIDYDPANYSAYFDNYRISVLPPPPAPEISVEQSAQTALVSGAAMVDFGNSLKESGSTRTFTIRNLGNSPLTGLTASLEGPHASDFSVTTQPHPTIEPQGSGTFTVSFRPGSEGTRNAALRITSNDADESPFVIGLQGTGLSPKEVVQQAYLKASNTGGPSSVSPSNYPGDNFGCALAISGDTLVVGAPFEDSNAVGVNGDQANDLAKDSGAAYVFVRDGAAWVQQAYLKPSDTRSNLWFGVACAASGDTIVIGASYHGDPRGVTPPGGAAYVFVRDGTNWTQQARLEAINGSREDLFGVSVAISGNTILVGAPGEGSDAKGVNGDSKNNRAPASGAAYVFARDGATWFQEAYLKASNTDAGDTFGWSVAVSGHTAVVGAYNEASSSVGVNGSQLNNTAQGAGAAYVFVRNGTGWTQQAYLKASNTQANDGFGVVGVDGDTIIVGAPFEASNSKGVNGAQNNNTIPEAGAAYVFIRQGAQWTQQAYLKASNTGKRTASNGATYSDWFGSNVAVSGDFVIVAAPSESSGARGVNGNQTNSAAFENAGAAYLFSRENGVWSQAAYLKASNTAAGDFFGGDQSGARAVAISDDLVVIGAPLEDSNARGINGLQSNNSALESGAAYAFTLPASTPPIDTGISFSQAAFLADEHSLTAKVILTRSRSLDMPVSAKVTMADDTAKAGVDYASSTVNVKFEVGETVRTVEIPLAADDGVSEPDKVFKVKFSDMPSGATSERKESKVIIRDDDRPGSIDTHWASTFAAMGLILGQGEYPEIRTVHCQSDGRLVVNVGVNRWNADFTDQTTRFWRILRLNADGTLDPGFPSLDYRPGTKVFDQSVVPTADGKFLLVRSGPNFVLDTRLNPDGSLDRTFSAKVTGGAFHALPLSTGKTVIYGNSHGVNLQLNGQPAPIVFRLNPNGTRDKGFSPPAAIINQVAGFKCFAQSDGKLLFVVSLLGQLPLSKTSLHRFNEDGSFDASFDTGTGPRQGAAEAPGWGAIESAFTQPDGKILVAGTFREFNGKPVTSIVRLLPDGAVDTSYEPSQKIGSARSSAGGFTWASSVTLSPWPDGRLLVGGNFMTYDGQNAVVPILLNLDGSRDSTFEGSLVGGDSPGSISPFPPGADGNIYFWTDAGLGRLNPPLAALPRLFSLTRETTGLTRVILEAQTGRRYTLQASDGLSAWTDLTNETATTTRVEFIDDANLPRRFYRVRRDP